MKAREQSAFKGFYAVTLITLLAICFVIVSYAVIYWSQTQNIQQTISKFGTASLTTPITMPPKQAGDSGIYDQSGALTVDITKTGGLYIKWTKGTTDPADLTTVYSTLTVDVKEGGTTVKTLDLLSAGPWQTTGKIPGSHTYDYSITYTVKGDAPDKSVVIPLTVELID